MAIHKVKAARSNEWSVRERERDRLQAIYLFVQPKFFLLLIFYINMLEKRSTKLHSHSTYDLNALQRTEIRLQKSKKKASWWARRMKENKKNNIHTKLDFFLLSVCFQCESFYWFALFTFPLSPLTRSTLWGMPSGFICSFVLQFCVITFFRVFLFHSFCCVSASLCANGSARLKWTSERVKRTESERFYAMATVYSGWKICAHVSIALAHWISTLMAFQWFNKN